jgi:hypothetical protein
LGNNNILDNIMHEKEIINELEKSLNVLIPIQNKDSKENKICVERSSGRKSCRATCSLQGSPFVCGKPARN